MNFPSAWSRPLVIFVVAAAAVFFTGCASVFENKTGSGNATTTVRPVDSFSKINLRGSPGLQVKIGSPASVAVLTDDNLQPVIQTTVSNDTLFIHPTTAYSSPYGCTVQVTVPNLTALTICGSPVVYVTGLAASNFTLAVSGASDVGLEGNVTNANFTLKGPGAIVAPHLTIQNLKLTIQGTGHAVLHVTGPFDVSGSGATNVRFLGVIPGQP